MKDKYTVEYHKQYMNNEFEKEIVSIRRNNILHSLNKHNPKNILEIGCGLEPLFKLVDNYSKFTVVEPNEDFVNNAINLAGQDPKISIVKGEIEKSYQLIKSQKYDFIIISSLLHEVSSPENILQAIHELCDKETVLYIDVPNKNSFHRLIGVNMGIINSVDDKSEMDKRFSRCHHFSIESLKQLVQNESFIILDQWTFFIKPFSSAQMAIMLKENIINDSVLDGLQKMIRHLPNYGSSIAMELKIV